MKKIILIFLASIFVASFAQNSPDWNITYGGSGDDFANSVAQASDGGYVMVGYTVSEGAGETDILLVKIDVEGTIVEWTKTYGGALSESAYSIKRTTDDGYIIVGSTASFASSDSDRDIWMIKTNSDGDSLWSYTYGEGHGLCVQQTADGGYIIAGSKLVKTYPNGTVEWSNEAGGRSVMQTNDGGYIIVGSDGYSNMLLVKRYSDGDEEWTQTFGGESTDNPSSVQQTADGGYIISVTTSSFSPGLLDAWLIKTDPYGIEEWSETYGGIYHDEANDVQQTIDGGYIMAGLTQADGTMDNDVWVLKIDAQGTQQWSWTVDGDANNWAQAVQQTSDGGYIVAGYTAVESAGGYDMWLIHFIPDDLTAWFTGNPTVINEGETVDFYDGSLGSPTSWSWSFDVGESPPVTSIAQNTSVTYTTAGTYDATLTVDNGFSTLTRTAYITVNGDVVPSYCPSNGNASSKWINSVNVNGQVNTSGSSGEVGYYDFTEIVFELVSGETYDIILEPGNSPGKKVLKSWRVWIDFNIDGVFDIDGEEVFAPIADKSTVSGTISIPAGITGNTRMRISMSADGIPSSCDDTGFTGEVEDYTVNIIPPTPQPPVADFTADSTYIETGTWLNFFDLTINNPDTWSWTFIGGTPGSSTVQNPSVKYNTAGTYSVTLTASNTLGSSTETKVNYIIVSDTPPSSQYCEPENIQSSRGTHIKEIIIDNIPNTSSFSETGFTYYYDFPTFIFNPGQTYDVQLFPFNGRARNFWRIWIDLNGDGNFEAPDEMLFTANNKKGTVSGNITIPTTASASDITRMRISMKREGAQSDPCDDNFEGEVEDYNVEFDDGGDGLKSVPLNSAMKESINVELYPNPVHGDRIKLTIDNNDPPLLILVYNKYGAEIDKFETTGDELILNISNYRAGLYFIKIKSRSETIIKKFVKM